MSAPSFAICALIIALLIGEAIAFWKRRPLFRTMSQFVITLGLPFLTGYVGYDLGYFFGALDQYLSTPGVHKSVLGNGLHSVEEPAVYLAIALLVLTLILRLVDRKRHPLM